MSVSFRLAGTDDAPALSKLGAETFTATFGHLYDPGDLATFLLNHDEANWRQELADPEFSVLLAVGEDEEAVGYAKVGPPHLPFEPRGVAVEFVKPCASTTQVLMSGPGVWRARSATPSDVTSSTKPA